MTIFNTPIITPLLRGLSILFLSLKGWQSHYQKPTQRQYLIIGAPHTSNWDMLYFLTFMLKHGVQLRWMGKHTLFRPWCRALLVWLGGIPVERNTKDGKGQVEQMVEAYASDPNLVLIIAPEGTRAKGAAWKSGFWHIAKAANVPIQLGYLDHSSRNLGFGPMVVAGGSYEKDLENIQAFYRGKTGQLYAFEDSTSQQADQSSNR